MRRFLALFCLVLVACSSPKSGRPRGSIATSHALATNVGVKVGKRGGNAIDAAIAAAFALGVVDGYNSGIGGGCFILIRTAEGRIYAIDGRETAPAALTPKSFLRRGKVDSDLAKRGPLAVGTPGALAAYVQAHELAGKLSLRAVMKFGTRLANEGFEIDEHYARRLRMQEEWLRADPGCAELLIGEHGELLREGDLLVQEDLALTYAAIAAGGIEWFYQGEFAERVSDWMAANGGALRASDFASYETVMREPIRSTYRDVEVIGFPPPSSGGVHVAQILNILDKWDLTEDSGNHIIAEAMKLAFADRAYYLGDPAFADVPKGLVNREYAKTLSERINPSRAQEVLRHGEPPGVDHYFFPKHTTHIAAADSEGNWVAITSTINTTFGAKLIVPGTGVFLNNEMDDFSLAPGVPNAFGLVGAHANKVEGGKRPLSSMSPTIVMRGGDPFLTLGAAGGPMIITQVVNTLVNRLDRGMNLKDSVAAPRFHHQWRPDTLFVERGFPEQDLIQLELRGHLPTERDFVGITQAVERKGGVFLPVADPRGPGSGAVW